jgi:hypothetical protein
MGLPRSLATSPRRTVAMAATLVAIALAAMGLGGCGDSGGSDPATSGARTQAIEELHDYGLTEEQATCIADELGAETVIEATDLNALVEGQEYRDAAEACIDG